MIWGKIKAKINQSVSKVILELAGIRLSVFPYQRLVAYKPAD